MSIAYTDLCKHDGWTPISTHGPQTLPGSSGGVTAFKFRDPECHPLELIAFPPQAAKSEWQKAGASPILGIDHSAISVSDMARSIAFYTQLGLRPAGTSVNVGLAQDQLDNIAGAVVEVMVLKPEGEGPHLELLCYRGDYVRTPASPNVNDVAASQLVFSLPDRGALKDICSGLNETAGVKLAAFANGAVRALLRDPDGHLICLEAK